MTGNAFIELWDGYSFRATDISAIGPVVGPGLGMKIDSKDQPYFMVEMHSPPNGSAFPMKFDTVDKAVAARARLLDQLSPKTADLPPSLDGWLRKVSKRLSVFEGRLEEVRRRLGLPARAAKEPLLPEETGGLGLQFSSVSTASFNTPGGLQAGMSQVAITIDSALLRPGAVAPAADPACEDDPNATIRPPWDPDGVFVRRSNKLDCLYTSFVSRDGAWRMRYRWHAGGWVWDLHCPSSGARQFFSDRREAVAYVVENTLSWRAAYPAWLGADVKVWKVPGTSWQVSPLMITPMKLEVSDGRRTVTVARVMSAVNYIRNHVAPRYLPDPPKEMMGGMQE